MKSIDWKRKLSSRKFWTAAAAWLTSILTAFDVSENAIARAAILISGVGALVVYTLSEAYVDGKNANGHSENGGGTDDK